MARTSLNRLAHCAAPAKLNLFLHVVGRDARGYHLLQTVFRLIDTCDHLSFELRRDGAVRRINEIPDVAADEDLVLRAARLLQHETACTLGADISVHKKIPMGGGLGGGSSDAATTLLALNRLWQTDLKRTELCELGLRLGADVPFFIHGEDAFAEGIGERLRSIVLPPAWYVVVAPPVHASTREIFAAKDLTRDTEPIRITDFASSTTRNDLQPVACARYPEISAAVEWLEQFAPARMTGSGACVFAEVSSEDLADAVIQASPPEWRAWKSKSLSRHPLHDWVD